MYIDITPRITQASRKGSCKNYVEFLDINPTFSVANFTGLFYFNDERV